MSGCGCHLVVCSDFLYTQDAPPGRNSLETIVPGGDRARQPRAATRYRSNASARCSLRSLVVDLSNDLTFEASEGISTRPRSSRRETRISGFFADLTERGDDRLRCYVSIYDTTTFHILSVSAYDDSAILPERRNSLKR